MGNNTQAENENVKTPGGEFNDPVKVALAGYMTGSSVKDFETLIVRTISQVIYGDLASSATKINDIRGFAKKNKTPLDIAENTLNKIESLEKINKETNSILKPISTNVGQIAMFTGGLLELATSNVGVPVSIINSPNSGSGGSNEQQINVSIASNNLDEVLKQLSNLANDEILNILGNAIKNITSLSGPLENVADNLTPVVDLLKHLVDSGLELEEFNNQIDPLIVSMNGLAAAQHIDTDYLEHLADSITTLSISNVDNDNIEQIINAYKDIQTFAEQLNKADVDITNFAKLIEVINTIKTGSLNKIDLSGFSSLDGELEHVISFNSKLNELQKVQIGKLSDLANFIDKTNELRFSNCKFIPLEYRTMLDTLATVIVPKSVLLSDEIAKIPKTVNPAKFKTLSQIIDNLPSFNKVNSFDENTVKGYFNALGVVIPIVTDVVNKSNVKINEKNIKSIIDSISILSGITFNTPKINTKNLKTFEDNIKTVIDTVVKINSHIIDANVDTKQMFNSLDEIIKSISILNELNYNPKGSIDKEALKLVNSNIEDLLNVINKIGQKNIGGALPIVKEFVDVVNMLNSLNYTPEGYLDKKEISNLNECIVDLLLSVQEITSADINKITVANSKFVSESLNHINRWDLPKLGISSKVAQDLEQIIPILVHAFKSLNNENLDTAVVSAEQLTDILIILNKIDSNAWKDKDFSPIINAFNSISTITSAISNFESSAVDKAEDLKLFINKVCVDKDSVIFALIKATSKLKGKDGSIESFANILEKLADTAKKVALISAMGPAIIAGTKVMAKFVATMSTIVGDINGDKAKQVDAAMSTMKGMCLLIAVCTITMLIGAFFIVKMPELVIGALAFGLVLGLFLTVVLSSITFATKYMDVALDTLKGVALLIIASSFVMMIGAAFVLLQPKLVIAALAFGLVLGLFIFTVVGAIHVTTSNLETTLDELKGVALLIAACAFIMMLGAAFVLLQPKLIAGAFMFTVVLGAFIFAVIKAINLASKDMNETMKNAYDFAKLVAISALVMMVGAAIVLLCPKIIIGAGIFTVVLGAFIWGVVKAINKGSQGMVKAEINIKHFAYIVAISAGVMLVGGGLFAAFPILAATVPWFAITFAGFVYVMCKALKELSKQQKHIIKGAAAMLMIGGVAMLGATAMLIISKAVAKGVGDVAWGATIMSLTLLAVGAMCVGMGALASNPFFWAGIGAMAAVSGIILIATVAMVNIGNAMKIFKEVGAFDVKPMLSNIAGLISVATALAPMTTMAPQIIAASLAVTTLSIAVSKISETVADVAALKIPIYNGTKKVGYRQLKQKDFKDASNNVKQVITILGKAVMDVYNKSPEMFDTGFLGMQPSPFTNVVKSTSGLANLISKIAESVKDYADLKVPIYSGTKVVKYRSLGTNDFVSAAVNISTIITTIGGALIKTYNDNPDLFKDTSIFSFMGEKAGNTPLSRVISVTSKLGSLISKIASGVQDFAELKIPQYGNGPKITGYKTMQQQDINFAKDNVKNIISTLAGALIEMYDERKELFTDTSIFSFMGESPGNTPLSRVISVTSKLGSLISKIASGVQDFAELKIPKYNASGKVVGYENMSQSDIENAADNVKMVISCLATSLIDMYNSNSDMFNDDSIFSFMGDSPGNTPLSRVISVNTKLGKLISKLASGIQDFGNLKIAKYDASGKVTGYEKMSQADIENAANNVTYIVSTLGNALMMSYESHSEWYKTPVSLFGNSDNPFSIVIATNIKLAELVSNIGKAVGDMAKLMIPTKWNKDGKAVEFRQLNNNDFNLASKNIVKVITTLGKGVMGLYDDPTTSKWFKDSDGDILKDGNSPFAIVMKTTIGISDLIKNIASGIKDYANLLIPNKWDKNGKAISYRELTSNDFDNASKNIGLIIKTVGESIMEIYNKKPEWFKSTGVFGSGDSEFSRVLNGCVSMGELISGISSGITALATLQIPIAWSKDGKPIKFREMKDSDFAQAANSIDKVVSTVGNSLISLYESKPELFATSESNPDSVFAKVAEGCSYLGDMIKGIAEGVVEMATIEETLKKSGINMSKNTYQEAADKIKIVVSTIGEALMLTFKDHKDWFQNSPIKTTKIGFFSSSEEIKADNSDTPFQKILSGCILMGQMITEIAKGISFFASITSKPLPDGSQINIAEASKNIATIITTIGKALMDVTKSASWYSIESLKPIISSVKESANAVHSVANLIQKIGTGNIPITDGNGKVIKYIKLDNKSIASAANTVSDIITSIASGVSTASASVKDLFGNEKWEGSNPHKMLQAIKCAVDTVSQSALFLAKLSTGKYEYTDQKGSIKSLDISSENITKGADLISQIIKGIADGIASPLMDETTAGAWVSSKWEDSKQCLMLTSISKAVNVVGNIAQFIDGLGKGKYIYQNGNTTQEINIGVKSAAAAGEIISTIITSIASAITTASNSMNTTGFSLTDGSKIDIMFKSLNRATSLLGNLAEVVSFYSDGKIANVVVKSDGTTEITGGGAPDVNKAQTNMSTIINGLVDIIKTSSASISKIDNIDDTINGLNKSLSVINISILGVNAIAKAKENIDKLNGFSFSNIMSPVLTDINTVFTEMNNIGNAPGVANVFDIFRKSPLERFIDTGNKIAAQSILISNSPLKKSYDMLNSVISSTSTTMENFHLPDNFGQQTESLDKFIKSVNTIKIDGVDSLTALLKELNKLGVNMGNMDKLTNAISNKLSTTLMNMRKAMDELNKTMIEDGKRKKKHTEEIRKSVTEIQKLMSNTMNVNVKMVDSGSGVSSSGGGESSTPSAPSTSNITSRKSK